MEFQIIIDESFANINTDKKLTPIERKFVLGLINDYEDGKWRESKFQNFVWDNIAETALSQREREILGSKSHSELVSAAKNLRFTDNPKDPSEGSEIAEIVLYGIMKHQFNALPIVPKIFYKQNNQDTVKGADTVHIVLNEERTDFTLWLGEAKFYNSISDARLLKVINSVFDLVKTDKLKKENAIITNVSEIDELILDEELKNNIKAALNNQASIDYLKSKINIPILLLHECDVTKTSNKNDKEYRDRIIDFHLERSKSYFEKQLSKLSEEVFDYGKISFHLILFPVPCKKNIVKKFLKNIEFYKEQS